MWLQNSCRLSPDGRVPRAILGRYLQWLYHFGENWLKIKVPSLHGARPLSSRARKHQPMVRPLSG